MVDRDQTPAPRDKGRDGTADGGGGFGGGDRADDVGGEDHQFGRGAEPSRGAAGEGAIDDRIAIADGDAGLAEHQFVGTREEIGGRIGAGGGIHHDAIHTPQAGENISAASTAEGVGGG